MKKIELDMVPQPVCENQLRATRLGQFFNLDSSFTCAGGYAGKDTCTGKSLTCYTVQYKVWILSVIFGAEIKVEFFTWKYIIDDNES